MYVSCHIRICSHSWKGAKESKSTCSIWVGGPGRAGSLPPPPCSVDGAMGGGGVGGMAGRVHPGDFEQGRGDLWQASCELKWQIILASKFGRLFSRVNPADFHGKIFWRVILVHLFGGSFWRIYLAGFHSQWNKQIPKQEREKKCTISESVDCIVSLYIASNIMLFCFRCRFSGTS